MTDNKKLSQERFNTFAAGYVTSKTHAQGNELDRLLEIAQPQATWTMLDIATGGGHTALKFAPHVQQVIASDIAQNMLDNAEQFITSKGISNVSFRYADAENLPFEDASFDLVTCRIAPHHFPDAFRFVQEAARVLKPGGSFLVQDQVVPDDERDARFVDAFETLRDPSHNRAYAEYEWRGMFLDAGLTVEHTEQITKRHDLVPWAKLQACTPDVIERLQIMLQQAPPASAAWLEGQRIGTEDASFVNHHLLILGRKPSAD